MTYDDLAEWLAHCEMQWRALHERIAHEAATTLYAPLAPIVYDDVCAKCGSPLDLIAEDDDCRRNCLECGARRDCTDP